MAYPVVAEHPACGLIEVSEVCIEIRLKERIRHKLDDLAKARHRSCDRVVRTTQLTVGLLDCPASLLHHKRQKELQRANWQENLRHHSSRGRASAEGGQS